MTHVVGAGLAGLSCAVKLVRAGRRVFLYEAASHAGGRCRSFHDTRLGRVIDNGNHLMLSGNRSLLAYLADTGAAGTLAGPARAEFPFFDLESGEGWTVRPSAGRIPWWVFSRHRRIPGTRPRDYLDGLALARAADDATVSQCLDTKSVLFRRFWEPMAVAVLNAGADEGAASLLWTVVRETFGRGESACRPRMARDGLGSTFVEPAVAFLEANGSPPRFRHRLKAVELDGGWISCLDFHETRVAVGPADSVVLALPPHAAAAVVPGLAVPKESRAIVNGHFRLEETREEPAFLGVVGGLSQWVFLRGDMVSVTVSAADSLVGEPSAILAARIWDEASRALGLAGTALPPHRIIKEKRATFAQIPSELARRPPISTYWRNLFLAGDWTESNLPATMEGAVRSGRKAADAALACVPST